MIEIGVAKPSAHGQAMIKTETAASKPLARVGAGPTMAQAANAASAASITPGTNQPATLSASFWIGARERLAWLTIWMMCASKVSAPIFSARITNAPVWLTVPALTLLPPLFSTATGSPLSIDSSTLERPSVTRPSTGSRAPGLMRSRSPTCT